MNFRSKKYYFQKKLISDKTYSPEQATDLVKNLTTVYDQSKFKFNQSINLTCSLAKTVLTKINASKFKLYTNLPYNIGKTMSIAVLKPTVIKKDFFNLSPNIKIYNESELISNLENKLINFDLLYIPREMLKIISKHKKILESKGLMPSDTHGTLFEIENFDTVISNLNPFLNKYSMDKSGTLHGIIGKSTFPVEYLCSNLLCVIDVLKTHQVIGNFIKKIAINATMSPSIRLASIHL